MEPRTQVPAIPPGRRGRSRALRSLLLRLVGVLGILLTISFLTFSLLYLAPGDLARNLLGNRASTPEALAAVRERYHLDDPFLVRYVGWLRAALSGDLGESIRLQQPVNRVIADRIGTTALLVALAFLLAVAVAVPLGIRSAAHEGRAVDRVASLLSLVGLSAPPFAVALLLIYGFSVLLPVFPAFGGGDGGLDTAGHLVLPAVALAAGIGAVLMRMTRAAVLRELQSDATTFARARGLSESSVRGYAVRAAAIPIVTSAGLILTFMVGGTIIVEAVFALPGLGLLLQEAVLFKDIPVVQGVTLLVAAVIAVITILVDLSYLVLDPRVRSKAAGA